MPPKKRAKTVHPSPTPLVQAKSPTPTGEAEDNTDEQLLDDPWTDEEEIGLFKGLIKYKPTGIHKHFRLLALHQYMLDNNYIHPNAEHTKPAGIWRKLETLYQLEPLDERENARQLGKVEVPEEYRGSQEGSEREGSEEDEDADAYSEAANKIDNEEFDLGGTEFEELKWRKRLPGRRRGTKSPDGSRGGSPPALPDLNLADEPPVRFTPSFSIEPSEAATPTARRGRGRAGTLTGKQKPAAAPTTSTRRSTRRAGSMADEEEKQAEPEEEEEEEEEESEEEEEDEEESEETTPAPRSTRNAKGTRGRGGADKIQRRGRGRRK